MQYLRDYINPKEIQSPIEIKSQTTQKWLHKLGFEYKNVRKDVFVDKHEQSDIVKDCINFINLMKNMEPHLVRFNKDDTIKDKNYPLGCRVNSSER